MARPQPLISDPEPSTRTVRVMLVDDSLVVRSVLERIVDQRPGLQICASVASAHDALAFLAREPVDVVVLDIEMPGMNGIDALPHILERAARARVLILSSNCVEGGPAAIEALALGASDTLAKPGRGSFSGRFAEVLTDRIMTLGHQQDFPAPVPVAERHPPVSAATVVDTDQPIECIAVAASTGGIPAFTNFLANLDPRITAPILLTQHLPDAFMEFYAKQIAMMTARKVCVAQAGMAVEPGHIYLAPGDAHLLVVAAGRRHEIALDRRIVDNGCCPSADPMLDSVADVYGRGGVAVILSGMGRDGALGAARLKEAGGTVFAQAPESCVIWGMPGAVAKAGIAAATLNPDAIALMLGSYAPAGATAMMGGNASESAYRVLMGVLESRTGQTLSPNRIWRIEMSLKPVMQRHNIADLDALVAALVTSTSRQLLDDTVDAMLNNETFFYREYSMFDEIAATVLEQLREINKLRRRLTIWHCGVSTGQEAYSLAMLIAEQGEKWAGWQVDIVGTDVSYHAISRARIGLYSQFEIQRGLPVQRMVRWFDQTEGGWLAKADLRRRIDFSVQNMLTDRPPLASSADLIFCRNLLLYFSAPMRQKAFARLRAMAAPQSFLVLGAGETVLGQTDQFVASPRLRGLYEPADQQVRRAAAA